MKIGKVIIRLKQSDAGYAEIDFRKNGKSFFCMDLKFDEDIAKQYVSKLEENLTAPGGLCSAIFLDHPDGDRVIVELATRERDFNYINIQEPWSFESKYIGHLTITFPVNEGHQIVRRYVDRLVYKKDFIEEMYNSIVALEPEAKSELVESILANGDLDSFYERIA